MWRFFQGREGNPPWHSQNRKWHINLRKGLETSLATPNTTKKLESQKVSQKRVHILSEGYCCMHSLTIPFLHVHVHVARHISTPVACLHQPHKCHATKTYKYHKWCHNGGQKVGGRPRSQAKCDWYGTASFIFWLQFPDCHCIRMVQSTFLIATAHCLHHTLVHPHNQTFLSNANKRLQQQKRLATPT